MYKQEIDFTIDKYNNPVYLSRRDSLAQVIMNGLFMRKKNLISHPDRGVGIEDYLLKPADSIDELQLLSELRATCGEDLIGNDLKSLSFQMVDLKGKEVALILLRISVDGEDDLMAITLESNRDNIVRYKYSFINDDVPV